LTGVFPLVGLRTGNIIAAQAALKAALNKVAKHEKVVLTIKLLYYLHLTLGFLAPVVVDLLQRVQKIMHNNVVSPRSMDVIFKMISFSIHKGLAAQIVVCYL
jgi:hypothetical protein